MKLTFGKHKGEQLSEVAGNHPAYLYGMLSCNILKNNIKEHSIMKLGMNYQKQISLFLLVNIKDSKLLAEGCHSIRSAFVVNRVVHQRFVIL